MHNYILDTPFLCKDGRKSYNYLFSAGYTYSKPALIAFFHDQPGDHSLTDNQKISNQSETPTRVNSKSSYLK